MSEAQSAGRRRGFPFRRRWRPGRAWLSVPVTAYLLAGLIVPIILIALYSVHLLTNLIFPPAKFSVDTWKGFLPYLHDGTSVYFDRFKTSMVITSRRPPLLSRSVSFTRSAFTLRLDVRRFS